MVDALCPSDLLLRWFGQGFFCAFSTLPFFSSPFCARLLRRGPVSTFCVTPSSFLGTSTFFCPMKPWTVSGTFFFFFAPWVGCFCQRWFVYFLRPFLRLLVSPCTPGPGFETVRRQTRPRTYLAYFPGKIFSLPPPFFFV